jgi:hypothetical protein
MKPLVLAFSFLALSASASMDEALNCKVTGVTGQIGKIFGNRLPELPRVGDVIPVDVSQDTITRLRAQSGRGIPVERLHNPLRREVNLPNLKVFAVEHEGDLGNKYQGVVTATLVPENTTVTIRILRNLQVSNLELVCN